jgi:predicted nuclease of predicted toxin-antitoxin system
MQNTKECLFVTLYIDEDITHKLAKVLRERGFDAVAAYEAGNIGVPDPVHLEFAASQRRALLTCNARDFAPLFDKWWEASKEHYGIIVSNQLEFGEMLRRVLNLLDSVTAGEVRNNYKNLAEFAKRGRQ